MTPPLIERASPDDLLQLAWEGTPTPWHAGAVLTLASEPAGGVTAVRSRFLALTHAVPRLRQRLMSTPPGCGRPVWVDDPAFEINRHVRVARCPPPGDDAALLDLAAELMATPFPRSQPPWSATVVTGLEAGRAALVLVFHHVLTDGVGGLAMLAHLVDGAPSAPQPVIRRPPRVGQLAMDAAASRVRALAGVRSAARRLRAGLREVGADRAPRGPRTSLNRPTGPVRRYAVARTDLGALRALARAHDGTVNDAVLAVVGGVLRDLLEQRGERANSLVFSVMVSGPRAQSAEVALGNAVGVIAADLPVGGSLRYRVDAVAGVMRDRKASVRGSSAAVVTPLFRAMGATGLLSWFINRQRMVNTIVTNMRGPDERLSIMGVPVTDAVVLSSTAGNLTVGFAVLSYAGRLNVTIIADPDACPDWRALADRLQAALDDVALAALSQ